MRLWTWMMALALVAAAPTLGRAEQAAGATMTLRLAVADIAKILEGYERQQDEQRRLGDVRAQIQQRLQTAGLEYQRLKKEIDNLAAGSPERLARKEKLDKLQADIENLGRGANAEIAGRINETALSLYDDILKAVAEYARENNIDLVIKEQQVEIGPKQVNQGVLLQIGFQSVLYRRDDLDITQGVVAKLNAKYRAAQEEEKKAGPTPAGGATKGGAALDTDAGRAPLAPEAGAKSK